ncbi:MAG: glycerol kinase GlpK [Lachnospiraceae bacterium]|nr:glycerol kinase GlpK [Lachnospiraceae bacterium]
MAKDYILALDQGTTSSRAILFDKSGKIVSMAQQEFSQIYPKSGWVEHNALEIWSSELAVAIDCINRVSVSIDEVAAIGITNQRETTIVWDKNTGKPIYNAIVWQCRRTADVIDEIKKTDLADYIRETTGLIPDAYFSASKLAWILDNVEGARQKADNGELLFGTVDCWLIYNLTKGRVHATDYSNASRTMLYDIHKLDWDDKLLRHFNIPRSMMPEVKPSSYNYGLTDSSVLGGEVAIAGVAGDQQAALFGQCCFEKGDVKNTYGTGSFILMNTGDDAVASSHGLLTTIAATTSDKPIYALEGSVFVAGAAIQWLRDGLELVRSAVESEAVAKEVDDSDGVYVVPAFTGLGAPYWNPYARGSIFGVTRGTKRAHIVRATLESIAYQTNDVISAMVSDCEAELKSLKVDGGASANDLLMQFQSDITNTVVSRPSCIETTALGAAYLAGLAVNIYSGLDDIKANAGGFKEFAANISEDERKLKLAGWKKAIKATLAYSD